ncbi:MAG: OsmC family protein [Gammaproteobacteria bacterium]|nr:OsmC family protein [Gammaproteobacteria bacterium]
MTTSIVYYQGQLRTTATHCQSGNEIITDAPTDNHGRGEAFSPTDLVATALASCMMTIMGIKAEDLGLESLTMRADVEKVMQANPRRIAEICIDLYLPVTLSARERAILEAAAHTCPVAHSLHTDIVQNTIFHYSE